MGIKKVFKEIDINSIIDDKRYSHKEYDTFTATKIETQIKKNGQLKNIVVAKTDEGYVIVDGYFIFSAMKKLGYETINVCIVKHDNPDLLALELNVSFNKSLVSYAQIIKVLVERLGEIELEYTLPMFKEEIVKYQNLLEFNFKKYDSNLHNKLFLESSEEYF